MKNQKKTICKNCQAEKMPNDWSAVCFETGVVGCRMCMQLIKTGSPIVSHVLILNTRINEMAKSND